MRRRIAFVPPLDAAAILLRPAIGVSILACIAAACAGVASAQVGSAPPPETSVAGRIGNVGPALPTATASTATTQAASTAFVGSAVSAEAARAEAAESTAQTTANGAVQAAGGNASRTTVTATGATASRTLAARFGDTLNVKDFGAKGDTLSLRGYCSTAAGGSALHCANASWTSADAGKAIVVHGAGPGGTPLLTTIAAITDPTDAELANAASTATPLYYAMGGQWIYGTSHATVSAGGAGYAPGDVLSMTGGAQYTVESTAVGSATIAAGGTGGATSSACTVTGTTGAFTMPFSASVTIAGGAITAINSITTGGHYWTNPTTLASEPVQGCNLSSARLSVTMAVDTVDWTAAGSYASVLSAPMATTNSGLGVGATLTPSFWESGTVIYGTDDWGAVSAAFAAAVAANEQLYLPSGAYFLYSQGGNSLWAATSSCFIGDGPSPNQSETAIGPTLLVTSTQAPLFTSTSGFCLKGIAISYPMQDGTATAPIAYPPTVSSARADKSTFENLRIQGAYDCFALVTGYNSAMARTNFLDNRFNCVRYGFAAYNGTVDRIAMTNNTWSISEMQVLGPNQAFSDPFGILSKYTIHNGEVVHVDIAGGAQQSIDGLWMTSNFASQYRYFVHIVSGGIGLSRWQGNYVECETELQVEAAAYLNSTVIEGGGGWSQPREGTKADPVIDIATLSGAALSNTDLTLVGWNLLHSNGDGILISNNGTTSVTITGGLITYFGQSASAGTYSGLHMDTSSSGMVLTYSGVHSDPLGMIWGHALEHINYYSTLGASITGNTFRNGYVAVNKAGFSGADVVANNSASQLSGPACMYDSSYATTYLDVVGNICNVAESNIWHPSQRNAANGITAYAGGGQASATLLAAYFNEVDTAADEAASVKLPVSIGKGCVAVANNTTNAVQVFGSGTDTINGVAYGTGISLAAGKTGQWCSATSGRWFGGSLN